VAVHSLHAHEKGRDALPLTFVRCWPTTLTAGFNDGCRNNAATVKQKCRDNLAAIELLKRLETEARPATNEEKRTLVRYVGWGGLPQVFDPLNKEWAKEGERLEKLLTTEELESARASTLNAHYTAPLVNQLDGKSAEAEAEPLTESQTEATTRCTR
jgi:hypothetical protein